MPNLNQLNKKGTRKGIIVERVIPDMNARIAISEVVHLAIIGNVVSMAVAPAGAIVYRSLVYLANKGIIMRESNSLNTLDKNPIAPKYVLWS